MVLGHDLTKGQRTQDVRITDDVSFDTMLLSSKTLKGLRNAGFLKPSPIQLQGIPLGKCGFDLLLEAKSGTGKTAVFTVIALEKLDFKIGIQTLILAPTREIASQICDVIKIIGSYYSELNVAVVMGGLPVQEDVQKFKEKVHIVVGSPGRLRHLIHAKYIDISSVRLFVLDEADKLMEDSFLPDINYIFSLIPKQKQVIMSSATYPEKINKFVLKYVQKAQHICPDSNSILLGIQQNVTLVPHNSNIVKQTKYRYEELKRILSGRQFKQCLIFCNYQVRVGELHRMLMKDKWPSEQLYGQQEQSDRLDALKTLQEYKCRILVSTDLAARGIDASNVDLVINFEPPYDWQTYLHRIGRGGRFGSYGISISILSQGKECAKFKETLTHSKIPFSLQDFWTKEAFNLSSNEDSIEQNIKSSQEINGSYSNVVDNPKSIETNNKINLWQALTSNSCEQSNDYNTEILNFDELFESFSVSNNNHIESFSDLIGSFNDNKIKTGHETEDSPYKCVKVTTVSIPDIKDDLQKNISDSCSSTQNHNTVNYDSTTSIDAPQNCMKLFKHRKQTNVLDNDPVEQALIEAGLPTMFGKPKHKKYSNHNGHNRSNNCNRNFNPYRNHPNVHDKYKARDTKPSQSPKTPIPEENKRNHQYDKTNAVHDKYESSSESDVESDYSDSSDESTKEYSYKSNLQTIIKNPPTCFNTSKHANRSRNQANKLTQERSIQFSNWFNQLRSQTNFIQKTLYIEELRRL